MSHQLPTLNNEDQFEDAICDLFNRLYRTETFVRFGRRGHNQKGIDVFSPVEDIAIQCKKKDISRSDQKVRKELMEDIEKDVQKIIDGMLGIEITKLVIVSTYKGHPSIDEHCESLKRKYNTSFEILFWGWDTIEKKMLDHSILLQKYWPNFMIPKTSIENSLSKEQSVLRNIELKKRIEIDFADWLDYDLDKRKRNSRMLLRDVNGDQYPDTNDPDEYGEYSWFNGELWSLYPKGVEFIFGVKSLFVFPDDTWSFEEPTDKTDCRGFRVYQVGQINFSDIVDYDINGDVNGYFPHFYCRFNNKGLPFEKVYYIDIEEYYISFELKDKRP